MHKDFGNINYGHLKRTLVNDNSSVVQRSQDFTILTSLDDVFLGFESLLKTHPHYSGKNMNVHHYLKKNFESYLDSAIENREYYKVKELSDKIGKIFSPKDRGFFERKKEEYALSYAFNNLVKQYALCKVDF